MNIEETQKALELMKLFADGKIIQTASKHSDQWHDTLSPAWDFSRFMYRVKPETCRYRRCIRRHGDAYVDIVRDEDGVAYVENDHVGFIRWIDDVWQTVTE